MIVALIVILVAAVFIERKCSSENVDPTTQKEINEYVEKAKKTKVKDKKDNTIQPMIRVVLYKTQVMV